MKNTITEFNEWFVELKKIATTEYGFKTTDDFDEDAWRGYWIDGYDSSTWKCKDGFGCKKQIN
jgi:hypothetical protein